MLYVSFYLKMKMSLKIDQYYRIFFCGFSNRMPTIIYNIGHIR